VNVLLEAIQIGLQSAGGRPMIAADREIRIASSFFRHDPDRDPRELLISSDSHYCQQPSTAWQLSTVLGTCLLLGAMTGWMVIDSFVHELEICIMKIPFRLRPMQCLLLLDNHSSHRNFRALYPLENDDVDIVMFPSRCSRVLPTRM
jgi:hypothetical protein